MHTNITLVPEQFGFRQRSSTEIAAFKLTNSILKSINQKIHASGIFCDLAKAFACVNLKFSLQSYIIMAVTEQ
jgi:hypothetical protein